MNNTLTEPSAHSTQLPLAPGFSRVSRSWSRENRFNGFPSHEPKAVETALLPSRLNTRLKPGANGRAASRGCCGLKSFAFATLTAALLCATPAFAQIKAEQRPARVATPATPAAVPVAPKPPVAVGVPGLPPVPPAPPAPRRLAVLVVPVSELEAAVDHLQNALEGNGLEQLNILFGPDTRNLEVSSVTLRNVTGPDALQFLATSAGCTVEPMYSTESPLVFVGGAIQGQKPPVIGYTFRAKPKPLSAPPGMLAPMMMPAGRPASATSPSGRLTRIYPLGAVTSRADARLGLDDVGNPKPSAWLFPDLEKTLREVLKTDGVAENQVSLAFHEKTNVLVVNSTEAVHLLVNQLLQALEQNVGQAAAAQRMMKLQTDLADRDKELRELQRELRQSQNPAPKPPSAK